MKIQMFKNRLIVVGLVGTLTFGTQNIPARADIWGGDVAVLLQILVQSIDQVYRLRMILGKAQETVNLLEDMNRGVKEVLRLAETAHVPIPPSVYAQAKSIDQATNEARQLYGIIGDRSPMYTRSRYRSGVEGLSLSQDAFDYSTFLDAQGESVKRSAVVANQASATRLTAETLGVILHSISHTNRLQAKALEMSSSDRIETTAKDNARFESFVNTHQHIEDSLKDTSMSSLNEVSF